MLRYFGWSFFLSFLGLVIAYLISGRFAVVYVTLMLSLLELSLSFDNAVVNAKVLRDMPEIWQRRFMTWGILIAVFLMRFLFPFLVVYAATDLPFLKVWSMALRDPQGYHEAIMRGFPYIASFGGAFLLMVALHFFLQFPKETYWFRALETHPSVQKFAKVTAAPELVASVLGGGVYWYYPDISVLYAYFGGVLIHWLLVFMNAKMSAAMQASTARSGLMGFMYLEVLDASFSFDGVVGAFAITTDIFIIMIGLGIGAIFVRSLTIYFVAKRTLQKYCYLEHGAHYAILFLALIMLLKLRLHPPEYLISTVSLGIVFLAFLHSLRKPQPVE